MQVFPQNGVNGADTNVKHVRQRSHSQTSVFLKSLLN